MRYFLDISYRGTDFHGWQIQPNATSIQGNIEKALSIVLNEKVNIIGAGRTDTGVHAKNMYAHFDFEKPIMEYQKFLTSLNSLVGKDIFIKNFIEVCPECHARFDAIERTYKYFIGFHKNPFLRNQYFQLHKRPDLDRMNEAANLLKNISDFTSFAKLHSDNKTNICTVNYAKWNKIENDTEALEFMGTLEGGIVFTIKADRFLRNMVRAIVGTLLEVGTNKLSISGFKEIIELKDRGKAGSSVSPDGLYLWEIKYPYI